jgi:hypothetical protein
MIRKWWVVTDSEDYGRIIASSDQEADKIFFYGVLNSKYPTESILIEQLPDDEAEEVEDINILSIEDAVST